MRGREEAISSFPDINAFIQQVVKEQVHVACESESEERPAMDDLEGNTILLEVCVQRRGKLGCLLIQVLLQFWSLLFQMSQYSLSRSHDQWMFAERARKKSSRRFRIRKISIFPEASVNRIHVEWHSGDHSNRHAAAHDFAVRGNIRFHAKPLLRAAWGKTESRDDFVEYERNAMFLRQLAQIAQECCRLKVRTSALNRFYQDCR